MPRQSQQFSMWFDYPDDPDKGRVEIRELSDEELSDLRSACQKTRMVFDPERNDVVREVVIDQELDRKETVARAVVGWENFFTAEREAMDCNKENKWAWACSSEFMQFFNTSYKIVCEHAQKKREAATKN